MAEPPDMNELAKRYLDLWQEHLTRSAADPETMEALGRIIEAMSAWAPGPGGLPGVPLPGGPFEWGANPDHGAGVTTSTAPPATGAKTAAAASDDGDGGTDFLNRRIARLEERIARLESGGGGKGERPSGRAKRR